MTETIIQFGGGNFLRAFFDCFLSVMHEKDVYDGAAVLVQATPHGSYDSLIRQDCAYHLLTRGVSDGETVDSVREIRSISRVVNPYADFSSFLSLAENPDARVVVSNTTEAGIVYSPEARPTGACPLSFPGKVTALLRRRYEAGLPGFLFLPCELIEQNGKKLRQCVLQLAEDWYRDAAFSRWIGQENTFVDTLVDRIVSGYPADAEAVCARIGREDRRLVTAEPYYLWVIEGNHEDVLPLRRAGLNVVWTDDVTPYKRRKVALLNGAHTSLVAAGLLSGVETVGACMRMPSLRAYLDACLTEEILPAIGESEENRRFAADVLERFENPFLAHKLRDIALNSVSKFAARIWPTAMAYRARFGKNPRRLTFALAALIVLYRTDPPRDTAEALTAMQEKELPALLADEALWGTSLSVLLPEVEEAYTRITRDGIGEALAWLTQF